MEEEAAARLEPGGDPPHQLPPVSEVLEHFDRDHPVEPALGLEVTDVGRDHLQIAYSSGGGLGLDRLQLGAGVGNGGHPAAGVALGDPERHRTPATAKVEHGHPILDPGPLAGEVEGRLLGLGQVSHPVWPPAGAVLHPGPEEQAEEPGRHLVVLEVGRLDLLGYRTGRHPLDHPGQTLLYSRDAALGLLPDPMSGGPAGGRPDDPVGDKAGGQGAVERQVAGRLPSAHPARPIPITSS